MGALVQVPGWSGCCRDGLMAPWHACHAAPRCSMDACMHPMGVDGGLLCAGHSAGQLEQSIVQGSTDVTWLWSGRLRCHWSAAAGDMHAAGGTDLRVMSCSPESVWARWP